MLYCSSPGAQSSEGSLQAFKQYVLSSLNLSESNPLLRGGSPIYTSRWGPLFTYFYGGVLVSPEGSFIFVSRRALPDRSGVERLVSGHFSWAMSCQAAVSSLVSRSGFAIRSVARRSSPFLSVRAGSSVRIAAARPSRRGF